MLTQWHEFYALLGTAAAALVALLFVAVSIATDVLTSEPESQRNTATYMTPVVFHYANILFLSLIALIPTQTWEVVRHRHRRGLDRQLQLFAPCHGARAP